MLDFTIVQPNLCARLREKFPSRFNGMTLAEIRLLCGKGK